MPDMLSAVHRKRAMTPCTYRYSTEMPPYSQYHTARRVIYSPLISMLPLADGFSEMKYILP